MRENLTKTVLDLSVNLIGDLTDESLPPLPALHTLQSCDITDSLRLSRVDHPSSRELTHALASRKGGRSHHICETSSEPVFTSAHNKYAHVRGEVVDRRPISESLM
ncbi:hypothetical protein ACJJTC_000073 [Scirpophaga incertulas]